MYLTKRTYIGAEYGHRNITGTVDIKQNGQPIQIDFSKIVSIEERAGYWRKANAIHNWFVENVQGGNDNCKSYDVTREDLEALLKAVNYVLNNVHVVEGDCVTGQVIDDEGVLTNYEPGRLVANVEVCETLPTASGFFFGSTDYDEWYLRDLEYTKQVCEKALADPDAVEWSYHASW